MKAIKKNFWLKVALGTLFLAVFLVPVSFKKENSNDFISLKTNTAYAEIEKLVILPVDAAGITATGVNLTIEVTGQPGTDEKISLTLKTKWSLINTWAIPDTMIDKTAASQTINLPLQYNFDKDTIYQITVFKPDNSVISNTVEFKGDGSAIDNNGGPAGTTSTGQNPIPQKPSLDIGCGYHPETWFTKCPVLFLYNFIYEPISYLTTLAAKFLDFFVYYSISSDAYRSGFVEKAWSVVRDISNMFFIIALLYIAIKTILQMNTSDNKRAIGYIIMIALLINFSLFATRVVIDASNILARVFYNNITPYDENGTAIPPNSNKPKSVSVGLVRTFEPQKVISDPKTNTAQFAIVTIIFIILLVYMILMFISISMLFLGRVAGLWMAMMFSPLAFTSVAMPFSIPKFSFKEWKTDLFKLAFMAPIYAFFLYVIILFGGFLEAIQYDTANTASGPNGWLDALMKNIIPFMLIFALLKEAKSITKDYAGKMGETFNSAGAVVGGLALGAATGGLAMAGRASLGRAGSWIARNTSKDTFGGRVANRLGRRMGTGSWDARNVKVFGKGLSNTGLKNLNTVSTPKAGGWEKIREDKKQKRLKRAEEVSKVGYGEGVAKDLRKAELDLHTLLDENKSKLESLDKDIAGARQKLQDAKTADDGSTASKYKIAKYNEQIKVFNKQKTALRKGVDIKMDYIDFDENDAVVSKSIDEKYASIKVGGKSIHDLETDIVPKARKAVRDKEKKRKLAYADRLSMRFWSDGAKEVAHKVRSGAIYENKTA